MVEYVTMKNRKEQGGRWTVAQGQAGVYQVASQLLLRGFDPCFPASDAHGVDILLESGVKVQVKSANLGFYERTPNGAYWFNFGKTVFATKTGGLRKEKRNYSSQCDFVILWGIDDNKFWIVPAKEFDGANGVVMGRQPQFKHFSIEEAQQLREQGLTNEQIGQRMGAAETTVLRRLHGEFQAPKRTRADAVRACEDAWNLIRELELSRQQPISGKLIEMPAVVAVAS